MKQNFFKKHFSKHSQKHKINDVDGMTAEHFLMQRSNFNQLQKEQLENDQRRWQHMVF